MNKLSKVFCFGVAISFTPFLGCSIHSQDGGSPSLDQKGDFDFSGYSVTPGDFVGINFKSGQPSGEGDLSRALAGPDEVTSHALDNDLRLLREFPSDIPVRAVGFTDTTECTGRSCIDLSLARAKVLHDWMVGEGIPAERLEKPEGFGAARPVGDNATEEGRALNRRAYISYGPNS